MIKTKYYILIYIKIILGMDCDNNTELCLNTSGRNNNIESKEDDKIDSKKTYSQFYTIDEIIGSGTYSTVYKGMQVEFSDEANGTTRKQTDVVIKYIKLDNDTDYSFLTEMDILLHMNKQTDKFARLSDWYTLRLIKAMMTNELSSRQYTKTPEFVLIFESMNMGSLYDALQKQRIPNLVPLPKITWPRSILPISSIDIDTTNQQLVYLCYQVALSLATIHSAGIVHRDIKPYNIFVHVQDDNVTCKIGDFGLAFPVDQNKTITDTSYMVTRWYRAPELLLGEYVYTQAIDIWSLACVFWEMWLGYPLFAPIYQREEIHLGRERTTQRQFDRIKELLGFPQTIHDLNPPSQQYYDEDLAARSKPSDITIYANNIAIRTKMFAKWKLVSRVPPPLMLDLLSHMLVYKPDKRYTIFEILDHPVFESYRHYHQDIHKTEPYVCNPELFALNAAIRETPKLSKTKQLAQVTNVFNIIRNKS